MLSTINENKYVPNLIEFAFIFVNLQNTLSTVKFDSIY